MKNKIQANFTPLITPVQKELRNISATAVYGRMNGYARKRKKDGKIVCFAKIQTIADELYISYDTTLRDVKFLCDKKYLNDLTPGLRNRPHTYEILKPYVQVSGFVPDISGTYVPLAEPEESMELFTVEEDFEETPEEIYNG